MSTGRDNQLVTSCKRPEPTDCDEQDQPLARRPRLDDDAPRRGNDYKNSTAQGSSRNVFGNYTNTNNATSTTNNTYNMYPQQPSHTPVPSAETHGQVPDTVASLTEALSFEVMDERYNTISAAHAKTCRWLFKRDEYKTWRDPVYLPSHHGFFWIKGKPGAGKSTLMKCALQRGTKEFDDVVISFFFNARGEQLEKSAEGMYRSLLCQLLEKLPHLADLIPKRRASSSQRGWPIELLKDMLREAVRALASTNVTCYIDALDECELEDARDMIEFFESLGVSAFETGIGFRTLLSSRHYPHITISKCQQLILEDQHDHAADILDYIHSKLRIGKSKTAIEIQESIKERASGVFLWVVLVIQILNKDKDCGQVHQLKKRLQTIPDGLHELFQEILRRGSHDEERLLLTFQWVMYAQRPLSREDLYFATMAGLGEDNIRAWDKDEVSVEDMERFLVDSSKGLAEVTKGKKRTVQFIHESVRDYLRDTGLRDFGSSMSGNMDALCHDRLKQCCDVYASKVALNHSLLDLSRDKAFKTRQRAKKEAIDSYPFLAYSLTGVLYHAAAAQSAGCSQADYVHGFPVSTWASLYNLLEQYLPPRLGEVVNRAYIFALHGACDLLEILSRDDSARIEFDCDMSSEQHQSLLGAAVHSTDLRTVEMLVKQSVSPNSKGKDQISCLSLAIKINHVAMARSLVASGASITNDVYGSSAVMFAVRVGSQEMFQMLLADKAFESQWHDNLTTAYRMVGPDGARPNAAIEEALCEKFDALTINSWSDGQPIPSLATDTSCFEFACEFGRSDVAKALLHATGDSLPDLAGIRSAFVSSARRGLDEVVMMLIDRNINVDVRSELEDGGTALLQASRHGQSKIVRILLDAKADATCKGKWGDSALHEAAQRGHERIVQMLLDRGVHVDAQNNNIRTPLIRASSQGHDTVVRILLDAKADANFKDISGDSALHIAAQTGHERIVEMLLDRGVDINTQRYNLVTPLMEASRDGRNTIVRMLLDSNADVSLKDRDGWTALHFAASNGHGETVQLLLDHGKADIDAQDRSRKSALSLASRNSSLQVVKLLLRRGARVERVRRPDPRGSSEGRKEIERLLLERGATLIDW
ncbi:hypothetical protein Q7P37_006616 [Cladosporium fusiforme]